MRFSIAWMSLIFFFSVQACAQFDDILIKPGVTQEIKTECVGNKSSLQLQNGSVEVVKDSGGAYALDMEKQDGDLSAYFGSVGKEEPCVIALQYAENSVNESYYLFVFDQKTDKFKRSAVRTIGNPEFVSEKILSSYNDGPVKHDDSVCYSRKKKDYYFCEKREQFSERLQKLEICDEVVCAEPEIVMENTMTLAKAHVVLEKSYFFDKKDLPKFSKRKAYLVKGDIVELQDYYSDGNVAYFKVIYSGSKKTIGWILEESIALDN
ncbi:hypothetical protein [Pseudomonas syringae]|uniref:hypothetical protein n=1 Tax=Pseudomonas syringae TaxID=317 RepID=UPI00073EC3F1|nr:hypothetical protein [Pseudomonas syringae]NAT24517.1 hypothetical protein [Pseudomonas syringae pv. actinidifoliorum]NAT36723.1 hypothetical protein [Pseudomonas syringae pv. actinidifoliorum]